jgi:phosphoglycolate phosphatase
VVTNKSQRFSLSVLDALGLRKRAACIVSGDTSPRPKPDPRPLLLACQLSGAKPELTFYVGDDLRDIHAGRAAGTKTIAVAYGYLGDGPPIEEWQAHRIVNNPRDILPLLA